MTGSAPPASAAGSPRLRIELLGALTVRRDGVALALPASRKVRMLIAYLALAPRPVGRSRLCELLWDVPNDPRGELRWCLSKIRGVLDEPGRRRVEARGDAVALDLSDCFVDVLEVGRALDPGVAHLGADRLRALAALFGGEFLEGLELDRSPELSGWLTAQRCRLRASRAALLERLIVLAGSESGDVFGYLDELLQIAPFDRHAHALLLHALAASGRMHEGDAHVAAAVRLFEAEGLDGRPLRESWRLARLRRDDEPVPAITLATEPVPPPGPDSGRPDPTRRASIAVMPFNGGGAGPDDRFADGLAHDVVTRLAKLRHLFVIAHATMATLGARGVGAGEAGRLLDVDYVVGGTLRRSGNRLVAAVELSEARSARLVWADEFEHAADDALQVLEDIGDRIVATVTNEIELAERNRAVLRAPASLTAWEAYHRGLWHVYRYEPQHNRQAEHFFDLAARLDPTWARPLAALSFTHFQNAFQRWSERDRAIDDAFRTAEQSLVADERDPSAHWALGRALWLRGRHAQSLAELEQAVALSPSFAHGHYTLAFVHAQSGEPGLGIDYADHSRALSPFDPLLCVMLVARAIALVRLGRFDDAADWALKGATRPNAFSHLRAIAAACLGLAGRTVEAGDVAASLRAAAPGYRVDDLLATFRFEAGAGELFREGARRAGLS